MRTNQPLRILVVALGGEGGGVLMNWIVEAANRAGHQVQATSVPGVAQRTGSTSYYIEIASSPNDQPNFSLVPLPGRLDVLISSELVETARSLSAGFVSPDRTTVISSTARVYSTAEKIELGDGRFSEENIRNAVDKLAQTSFLLDLGELANKNGTFVSATMFGALAGSGVLPWTKQATREVLGDARSIAGFDTAFDAVERLKTTTVENDTTKIERVQRNSSEKFHHLPQELKEIIAHGMALASDYLDGEYADLYSTRVERLITAADLENLSARSAVTEACRRLALWMAYEDIARVADLKTRKSRFERIKEEVSLNAGQILTVTEYLKPRAEEIADMLPVSIGERVLNRTERGGWFPFVGHGIKIQSNGIWGYWMLRFVSSMRRVRRKSLRFEREQSAIEDWLKQLEHVLPRAPEFAEGLGELPRVLKGYSDTLIRGKSAYDLIVNTIVQPAIETGAEKQSTEWLRKSLSAALADDTLKKLHIELAQNTRQQLSSESQRTVNA